MHHRFFLFTLIFIAALAASLNSALRADDAQPTMNLAPADVLPNIKPSDKLSEGQVTAALGPNGAAFTISIQPGEAPWPGIKLMPANGFFDLSAYGYIEAHVTNPNTEPLTINLRADNYQHGTYWVGDFTKIAPGQSGTVRTYFTKPADGFRTDKINEILMYIGTKATSPTSVQVDSLIAGGKPGDKAPVVPADIRTTPQGGVIYAAGTSVDQAQLAGKGNGGMSFQDGVLKGTLPATAAPDAVCIFRPPAGAWNLRDHLEVRVSLKNTSASPITPQVRLDSTYGPTDTIAASAPVPPGGEVEIVVPFIPLKSWHATAQDATAAPSSANKLEGSGNAFLSNSTLDIAISALPAGSDRSLVVTSIKADVPPVPPMPDWMGQRPPVEGDWVRTFNEEFTDSALDAAKWNNTGDNWTDKITHYSKDNVIVGNGQAILRYEKKTGFHNDDPKTYETDYVTGYLDTWDKFFQRYGYFECKMKTPTAPGMWPAFWLMPDRAGPERKGIRGSTADGGMELDIAEFLTVWGPYRYNIAMHWDGYAKDHKSTGSKVYFQPDKDGYITAGLLWTPGLAVYYANGREVLRYESPRISSVPEYIIFTYPSGGWDNNHLDPQNPQLPADWIIKYVRVWQRKDLASSVDSVNISAPSK